MGLHSTKVYRKPYHRLIHDSQPMMDTHMMIQQKRVLATLFSLIGIVLGSIQSHAQATQAPKGAREVLANFEQFARTRRGSSPDEVRHPEKYTAQRVDSVLGGLEQ